MGTLPPLVALLGCLAQSTAVASPSAPELERLRKALDSEPAIAVPLPERREGPVFRVTVHALWPEKPLWDTWTNVPSYIRPNMNGYRYDYLQLVTPEEFRTGTFYSAGLPIGAIIEALAKRFRKAPDPNHPTLKKEEKRAREEVQQALAELFACRADPSKPGC